MMYRTVLVHVDRVSGSAQRTALAVGLARQYQATLIGIAAGLPRLPVEVYADGLGVVAAGVDFTDIDRQQLQAEFGEAGAKFREATEGSGLRVEWRTAMDLPSNAIVAAANAADLIVTGPGDSSLLGDYRLASAGDVVMRCGRPVLVVPPGLGELNVQNVVVAWKDEREARRAVGDALPFMKRAAAVHLFHIDEGGGAGQAVKDIQTALARHQIEAPISVEERGGGEIEDQVVQFARSRKADLIVTGAYGHTRFREWVFGGMTRGLLANSPVACLMSH
jgi:nucleotide-binding universal stress UspA family protein